MCSSCAEDARSALFEDRIVPYDDLINSNSGHSEDLSIDPCGLARGADAVLIVRMDDQLSSEFSDTDCSQGHHFSYGKERPYVVVEIIAQEVETLKEPSRFRAVSAHYNRCSNFTERDILISLRKTQKGMSIIACHPLATPQEAALVPVRDMDSKEEFSAHLQALFLHEYFEAQCPTYGDRVNAYSPDVVRALCESD